MPRTIGRARRELIDRCLVVYYGYAMPGRNEPCPCGSGKKYKHCCLRADEARTRGARAPGDGRSARAGASHEGTGGGPPPASATPPPPGSEAAQAMLLQQTGFSTPAELQAAMDEYGRFCESLPDDADIPSFMEYLGRPSAAKDFFREIRSDVADRDFQSEAELKEFLNERMASANDSPREDFEGLSPTQMHEILQARETARVPLLRHNGSLSAKDAETAPLVAAVRWLLRYHADQGGGTRLTERDNYPRALCRAYLAHFDSSYREGISIPTEKSLKTLYSAHDMLVANDWAHESQHRSELTAEGVQMLAEDNVVKVFRQVFESLLLHMDWTEYLTEEYEDAVSHFAFIQKAAVFSLYLLSRHPQGTFQDLFDRFARAFPEFVKPAQGDQWTIDWLGETFAYLFLDRFCKPLGLVRIFPEASPSEAASASEAPDENSILAYRYSITGLFENAFVWP